MEAERIHRLGCYSAELRRVRINLCGGRLSLRPEREVDRPPAQARFSGPLSQLKLPPTQLATRPSTITHPYDNMVSAINSNKLMYNS